MPTPFSLAIIGISLFYSHLLHRIKQTDRRTAIAQYLLTTGQQPTLSDHPASPPSVRTSIPPQTWEQAGITGLQGGQTPRSVAGGGKVRLPQGVRVQRAGYYALTVAISYFVGDVVAGKGWTRAEHWQSAHAGRHDVQCELYLCSAQCVAPVSVLTMARSADLPLLLDRCGRIHRSPDLRGRDGREVRRWDAPIA